MSVARKRAAPSAAAASSPAAATTPEPPAALALVRARADGWTAERQRDFIEALADTGSVARAALAVGMSRESAYRLRRRADAAVFAEAWESAQDIATARLADACLERAIHGEEVPVFHQGELVGHRVRHSDALAMFLLRVRDPIRYGVLSLPPVDVCRRVDLRLFDAVARALKALPGQLAKLRPAAAPATAPEGHARL